MPADDLCGREQRALVVHTSSSPPRRLMCYHESIPEPIIKNRSLQFGLCSTAAVGCRNGGPGETIRLDPLLLLSLEVLLLVYFRLLKEGPGIQKLNLLLIMRHALPNGEPHNRQGKENNQSLESLFLKLRGRHVVGRGRVASKQHALSLMGSLHGVDFL